MFKQTPFLPDKMVRLHVRIKSDILQQTGLKNSYFPFKVSGLFTFVYLELEDKPLESIHGTMFGVHVPEWGADISGPGRLRCAFLSLDQTKGGMVADFEAKRQKVDLEWASCPHLHLGFPRDAEAFNLLNLP